MLYEVKGSNRTKKNLRQRINMCAGGGLEYTNHLTLSSNIKHDSVHLQRSGSRGVVCAVHEARHIIHHVLAH